MSGCLDAYLHSCPDREMVCDDHMMREPEYDDDVPKFLFLFTIIISR